MKTLAIFDISIENNNLAIIAKKLKLVTPILFSTLHKLDEFQFPIMQKKNNMVWRREQDFPALGIDIAVFEHPLGFALDFCGSLGVIRMPCSWEAFSEDIHWKHAFEDITEFMAILFGAKTIIYVPDSQRESSKCLDLIYNNTNKLILLQDVVTCLRNGESHGIVSSKDWAIYSTIHSG